MPHGKLTVVVEGATDIKDSGMHGKGALYCTLTCGRQVFSSPAVEGGGRNPLFNTAFEFEIDRTTTELNVCIYSKSSSREDEMVGYCTLIFKQVFYHGHKVPLTAFPIQVPSEYPGGKINISLKFKMKPSPNAQNAQLLQRCSPPPPVTQKLVGRQCLPIDWGYDCHEGHNYRRTQPEPQHHETYVEKPNYLNLPGTASENPNYLNLPGSVSGKPNYHNLPGSFSGRPKYLNFPGTASEDYNKKAPTCFTGYGNASTSRPQDSQTPNQAHPSSPASGLEPRAQYNQPIPGKPHPQQPQPLLQVQVQRRAGVLVHVAGEAANGFSQGMGNGLAGALGGGVYWVE